MHLSRRRVLGAGISALALGAASGIPAHADPAGEGNQKGIEGYVRSTLARMTREQKVGQLFVQQVYGTDPEVDDPRNLALYGRAKAVDVVRSLHLGGVIHFGWTDSFDAGPVGVGALNNALQSATRGRKGSVPLLVGTDQEQGLVARLGPPATQFPGAMALGAGRSMTDAREAARVTGTELKAVGINTNFAPVADVNVDPDNPVIGVRSFSSDPLLAARMVSAQVRGYQEDAGIVAAAKHFPGHGDTDVDSHHGLPLIGHSRQEWAEIDQPTFRAAIAAGVDMIMTAHLVAPSLDAREVPATLSRPILTGILREEMGYEGVIITDALDMAQVTEQFSDEEVAVKALEAGVDMLLMSPAPLKARDAILAALDSGRLSQRHIDQKVERILRMKYTRGISAAPVIDENAIEKLVGSTEHRAIADEVTDGSITLVRRSALLPFATAGRTVLVTGWGDTFAESLAAAFTEAGAVSMSMTTGTTPSVNEITQVLQAALSVDLTVVLTMNAAPDSPQVTLVNRLQASGVNVVAVAVRNPYDVAYHSAHNALCTYSHAPMVPAALVRVITGETKPVGRLPVDLPSADGTTVALRMGHGLSY